MAHGKRYREAYEKIDRTQAYPPAEAIHLIKETAGANFDETVELHIRLGVNVRHAEEQLRGTLALPKGLGKNVTIAVFAEGDPARQATEAGADFVGSDDLAERVEGGWTDFDVAIAHPSQMPKVGKLGRVLGPAGQDAESRRSAPSPTTSPRRSTRPRPARSSTGPTGRRSSTWRSARPASPRQTCSRTTRR